MKRPYFLLFAGCLVAGLAWSAPLMAAPPMGSSGAGADAVNISADESLEWHQDLRLYVARGHARAIRGDMTVTADFLTAHASDTGGEKGKKDQQDSAGMGGSLDRLTAEGHVHLWDSKQQVFGDRAVYDLDASVVKVTGNNLKYMTDKDIVTAQDSLEYFDHDQMAIARGHAKALREGRHIEGDILTAQFGGAADGAPKPADGTPGALSVMTAEGHVTVIAGETLARGDHAVYDVKRNVAVLTGLVRITRGETQLTGDKAEVDFATGESRLINEGRRGRVKALLRTGAQNKTGTTTKTLQKPGDAP